jgi:hypothetical protein
MIRSRLISGWPDVEVEGFGDQKPTSIRMDQLAPDLFFCLFEGDLQYVDLFLKPEGLHYGVDKRKEGGFDKDLQFTKKKTVINIPLRRNTEQRVIDIDALVKELNTIEPGMNAARFGMEMIDGSSKGRFMRKKTQE